MVSEKKRASQVGSRFKFLPAIGALEFIKIRRLLQSVEIAERGKEDEMGSKTPSILRNCKEIQGSVLVPRYSLAGACFVFSSAST